AIDGLNEAKPLQFQKGLPHCALCDAKLTSQTLLTQPLPGLAFSRKNPPLDLFSDLMSCHTGFCCVSRHLLHLGKIDRTNRCRAVIDCKLSSLQPTLTCLLSLFPIDPKRTSKPPKYRCMATKVKGYMVG